MSVVEPRAGRPEAVSAPRRRVAAPVRIWALAGAVLVTVELTLLAVWVLGPDFRQVPTGATSPPAWMKIVLDTGQVVFPLICAYLFYRCLWVPWRREQRLSIDGILCIGFLLTAMFDPISNYAHNWFTYNSYLLNFGSVLSAIPGSAASNGHGTGQAYSILLIPSGYVAVFVPCSIFGSWVMRSAKARWERLNAAALIGICLVTMIAIDIVVEGEFFMRLGFWSYARARQPAQRVALLQVSAAGADRLRDLLLGRTVPALLRQRPWRDDRRAGALEPGRLDRARTCCGRLP